ncbi:uncharacterized protein LODBEIA_P49660 [Lodderomyces beijingensis]|uniref:ferric-chelate reductase (NADPH) n=1 Tax=Lodderomyces beijingensis TaxID=1775926 RepID=A0ABP0ZVR4_9ASCO
MAIPFDQQFFAEKDRNNKYEWLVFILTLVMLALHGILFHHIPKYLRSKRDPSSLSHIKYFKFIKRWDEVTSCCKFTIYKEWHFYYQPSLIIFCVVYVGMCVGLCFAQIGEIDYQGFMYAISKRIGRIAVGNMPILLWSVARNDWITTISGFQFDRLEFLHKWLSRLMWVMVSVHLSLGSYYWLAMNFRIMIMIPPQIFGFMAYGALFILTWSSTKFIRTWAYDFWLIQHRVFAFIMLFMSFIHNPGARAAVLVGVIGLAFDRVVSKILAWIHKKYSPTQGRCNFEILDEGTVLMTIPVKTSEYEAKKWFNKYLCYKNWKAGQHIYINVPKIKWLQYHPFTIASLSSSNEMKILIRVQKGFTKNLMRYLQEIDHSEHEDEVVNIEAMFSGPYGAVHQPFISFDSCVFLGAGSGAAFTFPACLDLLRQIEQRDAAQDYMFRPLSPKIRFVWTIKHRRNIVWFKYILDEMIPYASQGKVIIDIYITQEYQIQTDGELFDHASTKSKLLQDSEYNLQIVEKSPSSSDSSTSNSLPPSNLTKNTSSANITEPSRSPRRNPDLSNEKYNVFSGRPDIAQILQGHASELINHDVTSSHRSLAVASCGPPKFANMVKEQCQVARRMKNSPDVYCYTESF